MSEEEHDIGIETSDPVVSLVKNMFDIAEKLGFDIEEIQIAEGRIFFFLSLSPVAQLPGGRQKEHSGIIANQRLFCQR